MCHYHIVLSFSFSFSYKYHGRYIISNNYGLTGSGYILLPPRGYGWKQYNHYTYWGVPIIYLYIVICNSILHVIHIYIYTYIYSFLMPSVIYSHFSHAFLEEKRSAVIQFRDSISFVADAGWTAIMKDLWGLRFVRMRVTCVEYIIIFRIRVLVFSYIGRKYIVMLKKYGFEIVRSME